MTEEAPLSVAARSLGEALLARGWRLASAESCTGGGLAAALTDIAGSSGWFECGWVTYANAAKIRDLGVPGALIARHGAVSGETVEAMAAGALARSGAELALAISGVAGPGGGSPDKPVGTVWFGWAGAPATALTVASECCHFEGDRAAVRAAAVRHALDRLLQLVLSPRRAC